MSDEKKDIVAELDFAPAPEATIEFGLVPEIDFAMDAAPPVPTDAALLKVSTAARRVLKGQEVIAQLEERLKAAKETMKFLLEVDLPDSMAEIGLESFTLDTGQKVEVKPIVAGSIPKKNLEEALAWLTKNGHAGLIKTSIELSFDRDDRAKALKVLAALKEQGLEPSIDESVHAQTLGAWARELIKQGKSEKELPLDLLGLYVGRRATVK